MARSNQIIELDGFSGYEVILYKNKQNIFIVKKKSRNPIQNPRLRNQYNKHLFFYNLRSDLFNIPEVLGSGTEADLFFYEYKFVEGETFIHFVEKGLVDDIGLITEKLLKIIKEFREVKNYFEPIHQDTMFVDGIHQKIRDNLEKCQLVGTPIEEKLIGRIKKLRDNNHKTLCHGDFTFDNIIIDNQMNIWLIDFLDLFYPHYWFDISKLFQDIDGGWYELKHGIKLPSNKLVYIKDYLVNGISEFDNEYNHHHNFLLALAFLRILPYSKNTSDRRTIEDKFKYFLRD